MTVLPADDLLLSLQQQILCRHSQLRQLLIYYNEQFASPKILVAHGLEETQKLESIKAVLHIRNIDYVVSRSRECLSQRHLLSQIFAACIQKIGKEDEIDGYDRVDSLNSLLDNLKKLLGGRTRKLVLVVDGADEQKGSSATLLPALARFGDVIPCISVILTSSAPRPLALHKTGVPYVHFIPYTRQETLRILLKDPPPLPDPLPGYAPMIQEKQLSDIYKQFAATVYDALTIYTSTSLLTFRQTCERLWPRFIWPLISGETLAGKTDTIDWNFARLLSKNRALFQAEGEVALQDRLCADLSAPQTFEALIKHKLKTEQLGTDPTTKSSDQCAWSSSSTQLEDLSTKPPLLKHFTTLVLLAAYLASHTWQKHDIVLFSRLSSSSTSKRKYLTKSRSGGITKTPTKSTPSKSKSTNVEDTDVDTPSKKRSKQVTAAEAGVTPKKERADRSMRAIFEKTSNIARTFTLERLIAILRAIHPDGIPQRRGTADRVYIELAELERLKLVVRVDGANARDVDAETIMEGRWKANVGREWVRSMGRIWGVGLEGWEID